MGASASGPMRRSAVGLVSREGGGDVPEAARPDGGDVSVRDLSVAYASAAGQRVALKDVTITVPGGRFVSVVGPSGCGKTSLLMVLAGLLRPSAGSAVVGGKEVATPRPRTTSVVFQDASLLAWRSVLRNVALPLEMTGAGRVPKRERLERARAALTLVGLENWADHLPGELSGGMKQRVALARGLVTEPSLLLMDEPFAALDEQSRYEMGEELLRVWDRLKITVVFITHSLSEAVFLSDEVIALCGSPGTIRDHFEVPFERPRDLSIMASPVFGELRGRLYETLRPEQAGSR